jgi:hypothetical protein
LSEVCSGPTGQFEAENDKLENLSPLSWVPPGFFTVLALYFLQKAIRPKAQRTWGYGRVGGEVPVSRTGCAVWAVTFLDIAAILAYSPPPPPVFVILLVFCFLAIIAVGIRDTRVFRRGL